MKTAIAALTLLALAGTAAADIHETQTFAGPYQSYGNAPAYDDANPANQTISATFTGAGYTANGLHIQLDLAALANNTYASEVVFTVTPPSGPAFYVTPAFDTDGYTTLTDVTLDIAIPAATGVVGTWTFKLWDSYPDGGNAAAQSEVTNVRISLQDMVIPTPEATDLGTLAGTDVTSTVNDFVGGQVKWWKFTCPSDASPASGFYVDLDTVGSQTAPNTNAAAANDTEIGVYDANGFFFASNDDAYDTATFESALTFGAEVEREHPGSAIGVVYDGFDGVLFAGTYYVAGSTFNTAFNGDFEVTSTSDSAGGTFVLNVYSNFPGGPAACSPADLGSTGGQAGQDNRLDNNDFIVFIDYFFAQNAVADMGSTGGAQGADATWDNNDFVVFIDYFFNDQANCNG